MTNSFLLVFVVAATGCVSSSSGTIDDQTSPTDETSSSVGAIDYETNGGFDGKGTHTSPFHIEPSGQLTRTKPDGGTETVTLDPAVTSDLYAKVARAHFASLEPSYEACCDLYFYRVTVQLDGVPRNVSAAVTEQTPARLTAVIEALHEISESLESPADQ